MVHGHSNDARFEPQEWFERHLEDRGGEATELICFEPLNSWETKRSAVPTQDNRHRERLFDADARKCAIAEDVGGDVGNTDLRRSRSEPLVQGS